jgi:hypothetical protein
MSDVRSFEQTMSDVRSFEQAMSDVRSFEQAMSGTGTVPFVVRSHHVSFHFHFILMKWC